jgi:hypothetical protein
MKIAAPRKRSTHLNREIAAVRAWRKPRSYHATIRECATWASEGSVASLTEAKKLSALEFERCYLVNLMLRRICLGGRAF